MNKTKRLFTVGVAIITIFIFPSCRGADDDNKEVTATGTFKVSQTEMTFTNAGGASAFSIAADGTPSVSSSASWLHCSIDSKGAPTYTVTVTVDTLAGDESKMTGYDDRTAVITVSYGGASRTVSVTQTAEYGIFVTSLKNISVDAGGGIITVSLKSNSADYIVSANSWITENATKAALTNYTASFTVASNLSAERTGTISFTLGTKTESVTVTQAKGAATDSITVTAAEIAKDMYPGWNLGNTMEAGNSANNYTNKGGLSAETSWQSTVTSQSVIDFIKAQGFKSVRIPCSWVMGHISDASAVTVDATWMERVKEVVNYCIGDGLYVIINDHWDGGWIEASFSDVSDAAVKANSATLTKLWTQIANEFKYYDEHLLFAGLNEPGEQNSAFTSSAIPALLSYEQAFIDAVRATGGNNAVRSLIVQGPQTDIDQTYNLWDVTKLSDTAADRLMVEVHYYTPWQFCGMDADASWGAMFYYWGLDNHSATDSDRNATYGEESAMKAQFDKLKTKFVDKGYPVILGEYGCLWRSLTGTSEQDLHNASVRAFHREVNKNAVSDGIVPFVWDTNYTGYPTMTVINRATLKVFNSYAMKGIAEGVAAATWPY